MPDPIGREHPDFHEIRSRAFEWAIAAGWLTSRQIDEAREAGKAALRNERLKAERKAA